MIFWFETVGHVRAFRLRPHSVPEAASVRFRVAIPSTPVSVFGRERPDGPPKPVIGLANSGATAQ